MAKITVIGAGNVGAECARQLASKNLGEIVLLDIVEGIPQGKALDMMQSGPVCGFDSNIVGTNDYKDTKNSDLVIITAGLARKPGMSRDDLLAKNAEIIKSCVKGAVKESPNCILLLVTNPLDAMVYLALKTSGFPSKRVLGMAPLLDASRMATFLAMELNISRREVKAMVLGTHGDLMVPIPRLTTAAGKPITELLSKEKIEAIVKRTAQGGAEIVKHLKTGSAYYAPGACSAYMAEAIIKDKKESILTCAYVEGKYGLNDIYIGVPAVLGKGGVEEIVELELTAEEKAALQKSAASIRKNIEKLIK
ncbi:MAG: malate dehydrogenase [Candidatus Margulisbacteria bacterium]|nr:malate dehydrogenase [Candidatus Margulisiibacteriota bacterium]MBU1022387.1 malate dehydrogenase [Candidatus Margulisiibacteriota bacterium]MBU1729061.1 malate dehydrogenase [Candidatus Margulisiibacteriota bacterium]MBU1954518.1 malate dehydrogenase [Candidatus Margulisiibacteriota bacterium]